MKLALITLLEDKVVVASWGISNIIINSEKIQFDVDRLKFKGTVLIEESGLKTYTIRMGDECYNCRLNNLVTFLDMKIECTKCYFNDLKGWIEQRVTF